MASGDRLQIADKPTLDEINTTIGDTGDTGGSTVAGTVMAKLNTLIDQDDVQLNKLDTVLTILGSGVQEYTSPGTYQLEIPAGITKIKVTACGGGGAGANNRLINSRPWINVIGGGGGGAAAVVNQEYTLENTGNSTLLNITVGAGGTVGNSVTKAGDGGATIIQGIVTLAGGKGASYIEINASSAKNTIINATGGAAGGTGGGAGGTGVGILLSPGHSETLTSTAGGNGALGIGGAGKTLQVQHESTHTYWLGLIGGGGGASIGNGGTVSTSSSVANGVRGGGGAGSAVEKGNAGDEDATSSKRYGVAGKGGNGYVKIEWGL